MPKLKEIHVKGVVAIMVVPSGAIIAATDFNLGGAAGFDEKTRQEIRAGDKLKRKVVEAFCPPVFSTALDDYTVDRIIEDLKIKDWKLHYEYIGYGE